MSLFDKWVFWMKKRGSYRLIMLAPDGREGVLTKQPYLERFFLFRIKGRCGVFLHHFLMSDPEEPHDHPWNSGGMILKGTYLEYHVDGRAWERKTGYIRWCRSSNELHRVDIKSPVWTLFWYGKRCRDWGWLEGNNWVRSPDNDIIAEGPSLKGMFFPHVENRRE